jgi:hypothetical protein
MMSRSVFHSQVGLAALCALALAGGLRTTRARADEWDQRTILTVQNQPLQVRQVVLDPGTYVLKLLNTNSARHIVQIYTANERELVDTVQAIPVYRARPTSDTQFTYWETPSGTARALHTWFYPGESMGQSFPYPDHPRQLESPELATTAMNTMPAAPAQPVAQQQPAEPEAQQPVEVAENSGPAEPAPAAPEAAPAAEPAPAPAAPQDTGAQSAAPAEMPKTASPLPLIGLCGLLASALGGLLRLIRSA